MVVASDSHVRNRQYNSLCEKSLSVHATWISKMTIILKTATHIMIINLLVVASYQRLCYTFPQGTFAIMQQSRSGEQRRLFIITNVTRVNSAIHSYCSCRRHRTIHRLHRATDARSPARSTVLGASHRGRQTRFPFIYFHCHFTDCQGSSIPPALGHFGVRRSLHDSVSL